MPELRHSLTQATSIAIRAAGLDRRRRRTPAGLLRHLGLVQLDTISVLARSHELVAHARLGAVTRRAIERAYWGTGSAFEYWAHEACVLPMDAYPWFAFRRRRSVARAERWGVDQRMVRRVRTALAADGPQTATELGGARREAGWWRWSDTKRAVEWMFATGEVAVVERQSWKRVYALADQVIPAFDTTGWVDTDGVFGPDDATCVRELLLRSIRLLGVGTLDDIRDVYRLRGNGAAALHGHPKVVRAQLDELLNTGQIATTAIDDATWYAEPAALRRVPASAESVTTLLSPFDPLAWYRPRLERLFGLRLRIEAYTPKEQRQHGYFAMPVLHHGAIIGLVDPAREGESLVARNLVAFTRDADGFAVALADAARWVGKERVIVERATTATLARDVARRANALLTSEE